jgi:hypothetical protein
LGYRIRPFKKGLSKQAFQKSLKKGLKNRIERHEYPLDFSDIIDRNDDSPHLAQ